MNPRLILASTSPYRRELLQKLGFAFETQKPNFDEEQYKSPNSKPLALAQLLAKGKAASLQIPEAAIIGSDQLISFEGQILGKPGSYEKAQVQLELMSGKTHELVTAVAVSYQGKWTEFVDLTRVTLRRLSSEEIKTYLHLDEPYDCAGSYKMEKNGPRLIEKLDCQDFTAIQGLPLIQLNHTLRSYGWR